MVVIGAFAVWYGRAYVIDAEDVVYQGGALFGRRLDAYRQLIALR